MNASRQGWIVSPGVDLAALGVPFAAALLLALVPHEAGDATPLWAFLLLIVAFDVSHVWATLYLGYLDRAVFRRRRLLLLLPIPIAFAATYRLHLHDPVLFWTLLAYVAIHHFISQHYGFVALYGLRGGQRGAADRRLDKWTVWVGALGPVLAWHASPQASFDWFGHGERFAFALDPSFRVDIYVVMGATAAVYAVRQAVLAARRGFNLPKNLWMLATWLSWSLGIGLADHPLVSLALINLLHGIPFLVLVWRRCTFDRDAKTGLLGWLTRHAWAFFGLIIALALLEEGLWDGLLWRTYAGDGGPQLSGHAESLVVACLALPQIVHYVLDAYLWKLDGTNPDLERMLGLERS